MLDETRATKDTALWKNATKTLLKNKSAKEGYTNLDMGSLSEVLMQSLQEEWERKTNFLKECALFKESSPRVIKAMTVSSTICEFTENKVILKDMESHRGTLYGIMKGQCKVVSKIHIIKETPPYGQHKLRMVSVNKTRTRTLTRHQKEEDKFLVIRTLERGDFFGFGERIPNTSVISEKQVELLTIPSIQMIRHGHDQFLSSAREHETSKYPSVKEAFENYRTHYKWQIYKKELRNEIMENKKY